MKLRVAWRNVVHYIRTDLKEIAFPSSLPNPPSSKPVPRKLTLREHLQVWKAGTRLYFRSWKTGSLDEDDDKDQEKEDEPVKSEKNGPEDPSLLEDLALASRAGSEHLRPALQRLYMTRASAYRDALKGFVRGYGEGIGAVMSAAKAMKGHVEGEPYSQSGDPSHQSNVAPSVKAETEREEQHEGKGGMGI